MLETLFYLVTMQYLALVSVFFSFLNFVACCMLVIAVCFLILEKK